MLIETIEKKNAKFFNPINNHTVSVYLTYLMQRACYKKRIDNQYTQAPTKVRPLSKKIVHETCQLVQDHFSTVNSRFASTALTRYSRPSR